MLIQSFVEYDENNISPKKPLRLLYRGMGTPGKQLLNCIIKFDESFNNNVENIEKIKILQNFQKGISKINFKKISTPICKNLGVKIKECVIPYIDRAIEKLSSN